MNTNQSPDYSADAPASKEPPYPYSDTVAQLKRIADALEAILVLAQRGSGV